MNGHADRWIDAYLDGELTGLQRRGVEAHLAQCPHCRELLEQRQALTALLQEVPPASGLKPEAQFAAEVSLQLKRRQGWIAPRRQVLNVGWQLTPVALVLALVFIQAVFITNSLVGFIPGAEQTLLGRAATMSSALRLPGFLSGLLGVTGMFNLLINWNWWTGPVILMAISLLYVFWLVSWWARNRQVPVRSD